MDLTLSSSVRLTVLEIRKDKKHFILEDKTSGEFYEMPEVCVTAINLINKGEQLEQIERVLKKTYPKEKIDLLVFVQQLIELNLVVEINGLKVELQQHNVIEDQGFLWVSPKLGKFFFNKLSYMVYFILLNFNLVILFTHPTFFPHYKDLFISNFMAINILSWMLLSILLLLIHEFGHILAMRANKLPTKLEFGHRLFLVVLETDMSPGWKLPPKNRNGLYLAGLCFDIVILSISLITQLIWLNNSGIIMNIMHLVVLDAFIRIAYQFFFYMKTDLYFVIENITGCYNLMENAQQYIRKLLSFGKFQIKEETIFSGEKKIVILYSIFYSIGVILTIAIYLIFYFRQLLFAWRHVLPGFEKGIKSFSFWDATLFSVQNAIVISLLLYSWRKKYLN